MIVRVDVIYKFSEKIFSQQIKNKNQTYFLESFCNIYIDRLLLAPRFLFLWRAGRFFFISCKFVNIFVKYK